MALLDFERLLFFIQRGGNYIYTHARARARWDGMRLFLVVVNFRL